MSRTKEDVKKEYGHLIMQLGAAGYEIARLNAHVEDVTNKLNELGKEALLFEKAEQGEANG